MEDQYANEARRADRRGDSRGAAYLYLLSVQAATNKLSDTRLQSFNSFLSRLVRPLDGNDDGPRDMSDENNDFTIILHSFLNNPDEPTIFRANAAAALDEKCRLDETDRRDNELVAINLRLCIQECLQASIEERNHEAYFVYGVEVSISLGEILDDLRNIVAEKLHNLEFPAKASQPYPAIRTSYGIYDKGALTDIFGDSISVDHIARHLTVGGVTCDCCDKDRDPMDLCSLLCCDRCQMAYYCSAECQRRQWKEGGHKKACRKPGEFREGDAIRLDGLKATPQYNNRVGLAVRPADDGRGEERRWVVRLYGPQCPIKMLSIKESNMRRTRPADIKS